MTEEYETQKTQNLPVLRGELALLVVVLINSLGVVLMLYSGSGISAISSVPYAFSEVFNKISLGTLDLHFPGTSGIIPDGHAKKICRTVSFQFCCWICIQRNA